MQSGMILVNVDEEWSEDKITDEDLKAVLYFKDESRNHQRLSAWNQLDLAVILFNVLLVLSVFLAVYVDFLYLIMFGWGLYVIPISISLLCPKLSHSNLKDYFEHLNRRENLELLFMHESDGVEHKKSARAAVGGQEQAIEVGRAESQDKGNRGLARLQVQDQGKEVAEKLADEFNAFKLKFPEGRHQIKANLLNQP